MRIAVAGSSGMVGRHVASSAQARGHDIIRLSRADGIDLTTGEGLGAALDGADVVIDTTNAGTIDEVPATEFFTAVAGHVQRGAAAAGVGHIVTLSIVGIDRMPFGYYNAKLAHERAAAEGTVASTVLRATQFHEFAAQLLMMTRVGNGARVFDVAVQPAAAAAVAEALINTAERSPQGRATDVAGPHQANLVELAHRFVERWNLDIEVTADGESVAGVPDGAMLPGPDATIIGPTYDEWLDGPDAEALHSRLG